MKILLTGGGSGGHFYPIIAIAESLREISRERKLIQPSLTFFAPAPYDKVLLYNNQIYYRNVPAGKSRTYFSILNFFDYFRMIFGIVIGFWKVFWLFPDVIFSKGGFGSFPVVLAGKLLKIPVVIHESDSAPGRVNLWAGKFAKRIAISYPEAAKFFPEDRTAWTGNPVRKEVAFVSKEGAKEYLDLDENVPLILIIGGSIGAKVINDALIEALPNLVKKYQIVHQTGKKNFKSVSETAKLVLQDSQYSRRYKPFEYLDDLAMRMSAGAADIVITRAGSTLFEIALWGIPSIVIPITNSNGNHQRKNAYTYSRSGAATVIEEANLNEHILIAEIDRIINNPEIYSKMQQQAKEFAKPNAARTIAEEILNTALAHEK